MFLICAALFGIILGAFANYAAAAWAWEPKRNNPWCASETPLPLWYRIPIAGWFGMRGEVSRFGRGFWIRPLLVEIAMGAFAFWFFQRQVLQPVGILYLAEIPPTFATIWSLILRCFFQLFFVGLMLAASLIDLDEKTIPDKITISGTIFAIFVSLFFPMSCTFSDGSSTVQSVTQLLDFPMVGLTPETSGELVFPLTGTAPNPPLGVIRSEKDGLFGLTTALLCWWGWCFALMERHWRFNRGWRWAWRVFWERLARTPSTRKLWRLAKWGTFLIVVIWAAAWPQWMTLWTTLIGMGVAGGFMWLIRLAGAFAMEREAMGFGDVTLMAMFGAYLGWQPCLVLFFIAPFAGLVLAPIFLILFRDAEIPFGPFLCAAAFVTMLYWPLLWSFSMPIFELGSLLFTFGLGLLLLMVVLLSISHAIKKMLGIVD